MSVSVIMRCARGRRGGPRGASLQHPPHRGEVTELLVLAALPAARRRGQEAGHHLRGAAQALLADDARLAVHAGRLDEVVVRLLAELLPHNRWQIWVMHYRAAKVRQRAAHLPSKLRASGTRQA